MSIKGHRDAKNKREVVAQILNGFIKQNNKWLVKPLENSDVVKGWFSIKF